MARLIQPLKPPVERNHAQRIARVALVQMDYNPSYRFKIDYLCEPLGTDAASDFAVSTLALNDRSMDQIMRSTLKQVRDSYLAHLTSKVCAVLDWTVKFKPDIVAFPEYSIPVEVLPHLLSYAASTSLILPSHTATESSIRLLSEVFGNVEIPWAPGHSLFVVIPKGTNGEAYLLGKLTRSQFESAMTPASETALLPLCGEDNPILVLMCSDFLQGRGLSPDPTLRSPAAQYMNQAALRIVCSLTPSTGPFYDLATYDLLRTFSIDRRPTAFVNHANQGGTSLFAIMEDEQVLERYDKYNSYRLPANVEAVAIYDIALGPQVDVRPSPLTPPSFSRLVGLGVLQKPAQAGAHTVQLQTLIDAQSMATAGVLANVEKSLDQLKDVIGEDLRNHFGSITLSSDQSTLNWRSSAATNLIDTLKSLIPSVDTRDRELIEVRIRSLESLKSIFVQPKIAPTGAVSESQQPDATEFEEKQPDGRTMLTSVLRLARLPINVPLEDIIGPLWSLVQTVADNDALKLEFRYDIMRAEDIASGDVLTEFSIEMFVVARCAILLEDRAKAISSLRDIRLLFQTGFGDSYRFSPVSESLWRRYRASQNMSYRVRAQHETIDKNGVKQITPYKSQPRIGVPLRFLFSRGEQASLTIEIAANATTTLEYESGLPTSPSALPVQQIPQKSGSALSDALRALDLIRTLRPSAGDPPDTVFCQLRLALELPAEPSALVPEVVFREMLGNSYVCIEETYHDNQWRPTHPPDIYGDEAQVASLRECLTLLLFPVGHLPSFGDRTRTPVLQVPIEVAENQQGPMLGHALHQDAPNSIPIFISADDRRKHVYVVGKTGTGKTQFLLNLIMQDIESGAGVCVMDPHGDLFDDILDRFPAKRVGDLVIFDPTDHENPPGLNLFEYDRRSPLHRDFVLDEAVSIFLRLHGHEVFGPRIQNYFRNAALALMSDSSRERTLLDLSRVLIDDKFFEYAMGASVDPAVADFLAEFRKTAEREKSEMIPYFQSKFSPFVSNSGIRNVIGQPRSTLNFRQAMDRKRVVLINLSKGKLGELNSRLLGMIMVGKVTWAALSRAHLPPEQRSEFFLYCDEFQSFATDSFSTVLSEARKYGLCLMLANQFLAQLRISDNYTSADRDSLRDAVLGNVGNLFAFRIGANDAKHLVNEMASDEDVKEQLAVLLSTQPRFQAVARIDCGGRSTHPFTLQTVMTNISKDTTRSGRLRDYVVKQQLLSREFVLSDIASSRNDYIADDGYIKEKQIITEGNDADNTDEPEEKPR